MHPIYERRPKPGRALVDQPATPGERIFATLVVSVMVVTSVALMLASS